MARFGVLVAANGPELTREWRGRTDGQVRSEVQAQALQELTQNLQEKCFDKCITRPNGKLDGKQQNCLALCINRYIDTMKVVSQAMVERGPQVRRAPASCPGLVAGRHISDLIRVLVMCAALSGTDCGLDVVKNESASVHLPTCGLEPSVSDHRQGRRIAVEAGVETALNTIARGHHHRHTDRLQQPFLQRCHVQVLETLS